MKHKLYILSALAVFGIVVLGTLVFAAPQITETPLVPAQQEIFTDNDPGIKKPFTEKEIQKSVSILAFGDMMLDRAVRNRITTEGNVYPFLGMQELLKGNDIVVANAEGVFVHHPSVTVEKLEDAPLQFAFDLNMIPVLRELGFTHLSQANNHAFDFGVDGLRESQTALAQGGIHAFGDPMNNDSVSKVSRVNGIPIVLVAYNHFPEVGAERVITEIKNMHREHSDTFIIVYPHWGDEYAEIATSAQRTLAHRFIDAGADVILGSHPHVVEPIEIYQGRAIFYSLGNFIFDQAPRGPTAEGLAVQLVVSPDAVAYTLIPFDIVRAQAIPMTDENTQAFLAELAAQSDAMTEIREAIQKDAFSLLRRKDRQ